jgi:hypothetical protein
MQNIGRTPEQQKYYNRDGSPKQGYSTVPSQQNPNPVFTHRGYNSIPQNLYKVDTPAPAPAPAAETKSEPTVEQAAPPVINNVYGNEIDNRTTPKPASKQFIVDYGGNTSTMAHSGLAAVKKAEAAGYSIAQIQQMGIDQGISFGSGAQAYFNQARETQYQNQLAEMQRQQTAYLNDLQIQQNQRLDQMAAEQKAASEKLALGQRTSLLNQARSGQMGALQIGGESQTPRTGGTQGFKRRKLQINPVTANALSGILGGTSAATQTNVLNV